MVFSAAFNVFFVCMHARFLGMKNVKNNLNDLKVKFSRRELCFFLGTAVMPNMVEVTFVVNYPYFFLGTLFINEMGERKIDLS